MADELIKRLDELATKLGSAGSSLWEIYQRQVMVVMWQDVIWILMYGVLMYGLWLVWNWSYKELKNPEGEDNPALTLIIVTSIGLFILFVSTLWDVGEILSCILNPKYVALDLIMKVVKPK